MTIDGLPPYRRAVLGMGNRQCRPCAMLREAAEFARLLELDMLGVFIDDQSLIELAALAVCARAASSRARLAGARTQTRGQASCAPQPSRLAGSFRQEIESQGVACSFEVHAGNPAAVASSVVQTTDVLIVMEPPAVECFAPGWESARRAALESAAAVAAAAALGHAAAWPGGSRGGQPSDVCFQLASHIGESNSASKSSPFHRGSGVTHKRC